MNAAHLIAFSYDDGLHRLGPASQPEAVPARLARKLDRISQLTLAAAAPLVAALTADIDPARIGVCLANRVAGWGFGEPQMVALHAHRDAARISPFLGTAWFPAAVQGELSLRFGLLGHSKTFMGDGAAFFDALHYALCCLDQRVTDAMLVGAVESVDSPFLYKHLGTRVPGAVALLALQRAEAPAPGRLTLTCTPHHHGAVATSGRTGTACRFPVEQAYHVLSAAADLADHPGRTMAFHHHSATFAMRTDSAPHAGVTQPSITVTRVQPATRATQPQGDIA